MSGAQHSRVGEETVAVVTGASSGIGRATALALAARGATVVAVARREERLASLIEECAERSPQSRYLAGDLGERAFAEGCIRDAIERHGRIDVLVNNAALSKHKHTLRLDVEECERVMQVNFLSALWTTLAVLPAMVARRSGAIVNVTSFAGVVVPAREAVYAASKAALEAFTEGLWHDLAGSGVHAAIVRPGPIDTEIWEKTDEPTAYAGRKHPAEDVASAIIEAAERRHHEVTIPRRDPGLLTARWLRFLAPGVLRAGMRRMDPNPEDVFAPGPGVADDPERRSRG